MNLLAALLLCTCVVASQVGVSDQMVHDHGAITCVQLGLEVRFMHATAETAA